MLHDYFNFENDLGYILIEDPTIIQDSRVIASRKYFNFSARTKFQFCLFWFSTCYYRQSHLSTDLCTKPKDKGKRPNISTAINCQPTRPCQIDLFLKIIKEICIACHLLSFTLEVIQKQSLLVNSLKRLKISFHKIEKYCYKTERISENEYHHVDHW